MFPGMTDLPPRASGMPVGEVTDEIEEVETPEVEVEEAVGAVEISPEAVSYRTEEMVCGNCRYMQATGQCVPLKMPVGPGDGCDIFKERGM